MLAVDIAAVAAAAAASTLVPVHRHDLLLFAVIATAAVVHIEASRGIERIREVASEGALYIDLKSMWTFAAVLVLPPGLATALVVLTYTHTWFRVSRRLIVYRWTFSAATVVLATAAAAAVIAALSLAGDPGLPGGPIGLAALVLAALVRWAVNYGLVIGAVRLTAPGTLRAALGNPADQLVELAALALGIAIAALLVYQPWLVPVLLVPVLALHRGLLLHQFERAARTDDKTGLANAVHWHEMASKELARAQRQQTGLGVLMVDLDNFKAINDEHGHLAGDTVLRAVAQALRGEVRQYDVVGRFGGEEFVVLLVEVSEAEVGPTAERLRERVAALRVQVHGKGGDAIVASMSASIGAAVYPVAARELDGLLLAADSALYAAKTGGRNRIEVAAAWTPPPRERGPDEAGRALYPGPGRP